VTIEVEILRVGARGDGIAETLGGSLYVPYAAAGDIVEVEPGEKRGEGREARLVRIVSPGPDRAEPHCRHFTSCGGCALQHLAAGAYLGWKRERVAEALRRAGVEAGISETVSVPPASRRRVRYAYRSASGRMLAGFREARSGRIVDLAECAVARPAVVGLLPQLRAFLARHAATGEVSVTEVDGGLDVAVFADRAPDLDLRLDAPDFCASAGIIRLSWASAKGTPEPLLSLEPPRVRFGSVSVELPIDAFLQPTAEGEAVLRGVVEASVPPAARVADLYAGCGAFALPLAAAGRTVLAVEGIGSQTRALQRADPSIGTETRDLSRQPLRREELERFDAVVLDPPRAGATEQVAEIAASAVHTVVYVSCNPATLARDARVLVDGGYRLERVQPLDQFLWSHHVELASVFTRS
jgi:23S rRNA (uracil1939-C5)-methyltransferase